MSKELLRIKKRKATEKKLLELYEHSNRVLIIHYSCESFYDIKDGRTPRVTSIAIRNFSNGQTESFSIHKIAEKDKINITNISNEYDKLEKKMLKEYFDYLRTKEDYTFVHWNMRDINYGFIAIEHRFEVLGGKPYKIRDDKKFDIAAELISLYGRAYIGHGENGRFLNLLEFNNITNKDALTGKEEAKAFENQEYIKLHQSTLRKVDCISNVLHRVIENSLKTNAKWIDRYGFHPKIVIELIKEHWIWTLFSMVAVVVGFIYNFFK